MYYYLPLKSKIRILIDKMLKHLLRAMDIITDQQYEIKNLEDENILIITNHQMIGDHIMLMPAIRALKLKCPNSKFYIICDSKEEIEVEKMNPYIDEIIYINKNIYGMCESIKKIKEKRITNAIVFDPAYARQLAAFFGGVKNKVGYIYNWKEIYMDKTKIQNRHQHPTYRTMYLVDLISNKKNKIRLELKTGKITDEINKEIEKIKKSKLIILNINAGWISKQWPLENFVEITKYILKTDRAKIILIGSKKEVTYTETFIKQLPKNMQKNIINLTGKTTLYDLIYIFNQSNLLITCDTGTMHLAQVTKIPIISIFGSTDPTKLILSKTNRYIFKKIECNPCTSISESGIFFSPVCKNNYKCMKSITPNEVIEKIRQIM